MGQTKTTELPSAVSVDVSDVLVSNEAAVETRYLTAQALNEQITLLPTVITGSGTDTMIASGSVGTARRLTFVQFREILDAVNRFFPNSRFMYGIAEAGAAGNQFTFGISTVGYGAPVYTEPGAAYQYGYARHQGQDGGRSWGEFGKFGNPTVSYMLYRSWMSLSGFVGTERWFSGLTSQVNLGMLNDTPAADYAMFRFCSALGDTTIKAVTCAGVAGVRTETDTLLSPDGTWRKYEVRLKPLPARADFYVDDVRVATHTTNTPTTTVSAYHYITRVGAGVTQDWRKTWMLATNVF